MRSSYCGINREDLSLDISRGEIDARHKETGWGYDYPRHLSQKSQFCKQDHNQSPKHRLTAKTKINPTRTEPYLVPVGGRDPIAADEIKQIHLDNLRRSLERRLQVATSRNSYLAKLLEDESSHL